MVLWERDNIHKNTWMNIGRTLAKCPGKNGYKNVVSADYSDAQAVSFYAVILSAVEKVKLLDTLGEWGSPYEDEMELVGKKGCELVTLDIGLVLELAEDLTGLKFADWDDWDDYHLVKNIFEILKENRDKIERWLVFFLTDYPVLVTTFEGKSGELSHQNYLISPRVYGDEKELSILEGE